MSGDSHPNDDADFLDEDFVVEDLGGKNDDLEDLFDAPTNKQDAADDDEQEGAEPDSDDLLFTDHTQGIDPSENFEGREAFAEDSEARWDGEELDLDEAVTSDDVGGSGDAVGADGVEDPVFDDAKEQFTEELDSMLAEEDFGIDSEDELELVDAGDGEDGISEFEQSGPFVLDDGDGLWADDDALAEDPQPETVEAEADDEMFAAAQLSEEPEELETLESVEEPMLNDDALDAVEMQLLDATGDEEGGAGWEPLPRTSVDALSEVDEVQRTDDEEEEHDLSGYEDDDGIYADSEEVAADATVPVARSPQDLEDVEGHDIYGEDEEEEAVVVGGPIARRSRVWGTLVSIAATLLLMGGAATVVLRPQWFGLSFEPERVERVEVDRPRIEVAVVEPPSPFDEPPAGDTDQQVGQADPATNDPSGEGAPTDVPAPQTGEDGGQKVADAGQENTPANGEQTPETSTDPNVGEVGQPGPVAVTDPTVAPQPVDPQPVDPQTVQPQVEPIAAQAGEGEGVEAQQPVVVTPPKGEPAWPVEQAPETPVVAQRGDVAGSQLARFGDGLMVGDLSAGNSRIGEAVDGVLPGSRAFAQLANGNYFIGSVKQVAAETITLRVESGEVTLKNADIVQLTQLGSTDYEELQNATKGFVRLTNNNRLVGGILSRIADDHIVLEFRKNRVMLPRSAIGEIVSSDVETGSNVRLDTTSEEDDWLRKIAERELGTGQGVELEPESLPPGTRRSGPPR